LIQDGEDQILLIPDEIAFGVDVDVIIERRGDVVTIRPWKAEPRSVSIGDQTP